jgi:pyruvate,water dikinase
VTGPNVRWTDAPGATVAELGGKVNSLAEMVGAGFDVPPAFGITTTAFRAFMDAAGVADAIDRLRRDLDPGDLAQVQHVSDAICALIASSPLPAAVERDIRDAYAELERSSDHPGVPVAVRSSGVNEDLDGASFAGQYDTYLWISGADAVLEHVKRCWTGMFGPAVLTYRPNERVSLADAGSPGMCVGVQEMVRARAAGVMFTLDPVSGDRSKIVIESCWGLGEGVVKGDVTPDRHRIDKVTLRIVDREIAVQESEYRFDAELGEVALLAISAERGAAASLSEEEALRVAELGRRVERHRGAPQDLEWALSHDGELRLLQARPETVWAARRAAERAARPDPAGAADRVVSTFLRFGPGSGT